MRNPIASLNQMRLLALTLTALVAVPPVPAGARDDFRQDSDDAQSYATVSQDGELEAPQAQVPIGTQVQNSVGASKASALVQGKFQEMKQALAGGQPLRTQDIKSSFAKELNAIPSSQLSGAEKAELRKEFNTNVDNVQAMAKGGDLVAARAGLKTGDYTLVLTSFNDLSVKVDGGKTGKTIDLKPMAMRGPQNAIQSSVADVKFTVPPGQTLSFNLTAESAKTTYAVVKGSVEHKSYQSYATSITVEPTGLQSNEASMRTDLAKVGGTLNIVSNGTPATFTGTVQDSGNFTPSITFTGNGPAAPQTLASVPAAAPAGDGAGPSSPAGPPPGLNPVGNALFSNGDFTYSGFTGVQAVGVQPGKTATVGFENANVQLSGNSFMVGEIGAIKPGSDGLSVVNQGRTAIMFTPSDFEANVPALASLGVNVSPSVVAAVKQEVAERGPDNNGRGQVGVLVDLRPGAPQQVAVTEFTDNGLQNNAIDDFRSRGLPDNTTVGNLDVSFGAAPTDGMVGFLDRLDGVATVAGAYSGVPGGQKTGLLNVGALNVPLKIGNSAVLTTPASITVKNGAATLTDRSAAVVMMNKNDFSANTRSLGMLGVKPSEIQKGTGANFVVIDFRASGGPTVRPLDLSSSDSSGHVFLNGVTDDIRNLSR